MPHARYSYQDPDTEKWLSLGFTEYVARRPQQRVFQYGTLNILAQGVRILYNIPHSNDLHGFNIFGRPKASFCCSCHVCTCIVLHLVRRVSKPHPSTFGGRAKCIAASIVPGFVSIDR
jgi:hypothetical protein